MRTASVRELKNKTSELLRRAAREEVVITSRGRPVACLVGLSERDLEVKPARARGWDKEALFRLASRLWKLKAERGKKWVSQAGHDRVLYGK